MLKVIEIVKGGFGKVKQFNPYSRPIFAGMGDEVLLTPHCQKYDVLLELMTNINNKSKSMSYFKRLMPSLFLVETAKHKLNFGECLVKDEYGIYFIDTNKECTESTAFALLANEVKKIVYSGGGKEEMIDTILDLNQLLLTFDIEIVKSDEVGLLMAFGIEYIKDINDPEIVYLKIDNPFKEGVINARHGQ